MDKQTPLSMDEGYSWVHTMGIELCGGDYVGRVDEEYKVLKTAVYEIDAVDLDS